MERHMRLTLPAIAAVGSAVAAVAGQDGCLGVGAAAHSSINPVSCGWTALAGHAGTWRSQVRCSLRPEFAGKPELPALPGWEAPVQHGTPFVANASSSQHLGDVPLACNIGVVLHAGGTRWLKIVTTT
jgi:hypothetical protein